MGRWGGAERETDKNANPRSADNLVVNSQTLKTVPTSRIRKRSNPARNPLHVQPHEVQPSERRRSLYVLHAMVLHVTPVTFR
jgi:hypothetical protein